MSRSRTSPSRDEMKCGNIFCRADEEQKLCQNRSRKQLINHLCIFVVAAVVHIVREKKSAK